MRGKSWRKPGGQPGHRGDTLKRSPAPIRIEVTGHRAAKTFRLDPKLGAEAMERGGLIPAYRGNLVHDCLGSRQFRRSQCIIAITEDFTLGNAAVRA